jgi:diguanylate cyclase (GGDEF)-like protein
MKPDPTIVATIPATRLDGDDMGSHEAFLIVLAGADVGHVFPLTSDVTLIGRDDIAEIQIFDGSISRRHALVTRDPGTNRYSIGDLGSRNGTQVNSVPIEDSHELQRGDKIQLGVTTVLRFSYGDESETLYAQRMYEAVLKDALTGIFNRRYLFQRLASELSFSRRHKTPLALCFLDLDHFKRINDTYNHQCGDSVLRQTAQVIEKTIRAEDVLARYGGEEFAIICRDSTEHQAAIMAERVRRLIEANTFVFDEFELKLTISIGVAALDDNDLTTMEALIAAADGAVLQAKESGRNRVVRHSELDRG